MTSTQGSLGASSPPPPHSPQRDRTLLRCCLRGLPSPVCAHQRAPWLPFCAGSPQVADPISVPPQPLASSVPGFVPCSWGARRVPYTGQKGRTPGSPGDKLPPGPRPGISSSPHPKDRGKATTWGLRGLGAKRDGGRAALRVRGFPGLGPSSAKPITPRPADPPTLDRRTGRMALCSSLHKGAKVGQGRAGPRGPRDHSAAGRGCSAGRRGPTQRRAGLGGGPHCQGWRSVPEEHRPPGARPGGGGSG